jgi:3-dehydroquinate synthase
MIADARLFDFLEQNHKALASRDLAILQQLIERSAAIKIAIVERDEREQGDRARLNLGHTFAHAIESFSDLDLRHGEAVAIGLCAATHVSATRGPMTSAERDRVLNLLTTFNLPTRLPRAVPAAPLIESMRHDKKVAFGLLRLILPIGLGAARVADDVPLELIENAWQSVGAAVD